MGRRKNDENLSAYEEVDRVYQWAVQTNHDQIAKALRRALQKMREEQCTSRVNHHADVAC